MTRSRYAARDAFIKENHLRNGPDRSRGLSSGGAKLCAELGCPQMRWPGRAYPDGREVLLVALALVARIDTLRIGMPDVDAGALAGRAGDRDNKAPRSTAASGNRHREIRRYP